MKNRLLVGMAIGALTFCFGTGVFAVSNLQEIKAYLNGDIRFMVNGEDYRLKNEEGYEILPIMHDNKVYIPVRAAADALKVPVDYDQDTSTVILGEKPDGTTLFSKAIKLNMTHNGAEDILDQTQLIMNGKQFKGAFRVDISQHNLSINLGKNYTKAHLVLGSLGETSTVKITNKDDQILAEPVVEKDRALEIDVDLHSTDTLKFIVTGTKNTGKFYVYKESTLQ